MISLSSADYDELRGLGMSVTQAKRVIRYREERGGFGSVEELIAQMHRDVDQARSLCESFEPPR